jgi:DNA-binding protein YbaB
MKQAQATQENIQKAQQELANTLPVSLVVAW